jgi:NAD(P)-dependent dehydrogenase (short-subunit alcohol dehydrogenase family)
MWRLAKLFDLIMSITVAGKTALVTGAGRGIGKGIARVLGSEGAKVLVSNRSEVTARAVAAAIRDAGGQASHVACDVTREADLRRAVATVIERYGRLDILAHNAGIYPIAPIEAMSEQLWDEVIDTNLKGTFFAAKAAFEVMKPQGCGRIIITSSITGPRTGIAGAGALRSFEGRHQRLHQGCGDRVRPLWRNSQCDRAWHHRNREGRRPRRGIPAKSGSGVADQAARNGRGLRLRCALSGQRPGRLYHASDDCRRWRTAASRIAERPRD